MASYDVLIVGGGIIGCTLARSLAREGVKVGVIERGAPGGEASSAAAGMLSPSAEAEKNSPLFPLCRASLELYGPLAADLYSETGIDPQYRTEGALLLYANENDRQALLPSIDWQRSQGLTIQELSQSELRSREPQLNAFGGGFFLPGDHKIDNRALMQALVQSCRQRGVTFLLGKNVTEIKPNGKAEIRVIANGEIFSAPQVVNTSGAWAAQISVAGLPPPPIRPVKGHILVLENSEEPLRHVIRSHRCYLVPRRGGKVIVGSTMEEAGFDKSPRAGPLTRLLVAAQETCPALAGSVVSDLWAGLRPASSDGLPLVGPTEIKGYFLGLGHFRNGILLAPVTAEILAGLLLRGESPYPISPILPSRFS
ncbi:MAG: glycine oxidase ThiO [Acidobacteria bacterium RIFCSPLOWO2_12_FULL_54_10]|nr:MAG: glycine oxidase ThiO [Acidobacteria bacterium RIFCSPLOWO2_12_FULL_54_10]